MPAVRARPPSASMPSTHPPLPENLSLQMSAGHPMRPCFARSASGGAHIRTCTDTHIRTHMLADGGQGLEKQQLSQSATISSISTRAGQVEVPHRQITSAITEIKSWKVSRRGSTKWCLYWTVLACVLIKESTAKSASLEITAPLLVLIEVQSREGKFFFTHFSFLPHKMLETWK